MKVIEKVRTLAGEGRWVGYPVSLVRTRYCNLNCAWCDTKRKMAREGKNYSVEELILWIKEGPKHVLFTGGEPLLSSDAGMFIEQCIKEGYFVIIETNGTIHISLTTLALDTQVQNNTSICMDIKPPSSGNPTTDFNIHRSLSSQDEIRMPVHSDSDIVYFEDIVLPLLPTFKAPFRLSPVYDSVYIFRVTWLKDYLLRNSYAIPLSIQIHKFLNIP